MLLAYAAATLVATALARQNFPLPKNGRIGCVDGLRGYLALSVLMHHFIVWLQITRLGFNWEAPTNNLFNNLGAGAVALFFMVTGLVFYPVVLAGLKRSAWPSIYVKRAFRILPLVIVSVGIVTLIIIWRNGIGSGSNFVVSLAKWLTSWSEPDLLGYANSGRTNAYVLWSLWYEWLFYLLVLPACALAMDLIHGKFASWVIPLILLLMSLALRSVLTKQLILFLPLFAIGMIAYELQRIERVRTWFQGSIAALVSSCALIIAATAWPTPYGLPCLAMYGFFFISVACGNSLFGLLSSRGALLLGEISFSLYLLHGVVLSLLFTEGASLTQAFATTQLPAIFPFAAIIVVLVTSLTFLFIERPLISIGAAIARSESPVRIGAVRASPVLQGGQHKKTDVD
jgi:peptidoglycan/LPS O-acetylase OafA/YrhL